MESCFITIVLYLQEKIRIGKIFTGAKTGSVTFLQQFGGSINFNIHFHILYTDGVWTVNQGKASFFSLSFIQDCKKSLNTSSFSKKGLLFFLYSLHSMRFRLIFLVFLKKIFYKFLIGNLLIKLHEV